MKLLGADDSSKNDESHRVNDSSDPNERGDSQDLDDGPAPTSAANVPDTPADVLLELGMVPKAFICQVIDEHGGNMWQQALVAVTGWSESKMSRLLTEMESDGMIERREIGREKLVLLTDAGRDGE